MKIVNQHQMRSAFLAIIVLSIFLVRLQADNKHDGPGPTETQSKLWLEGDSSLHRYSSTAHNLLVDFGVPTDKSIIEQLKSGKLKTLEVTVPIKDMRSGKSSLDKNMQKALKADENPNILFHLSSYEVVPSTIPTQGLMIQARGLLEISGVKKDVVLEGNLTQENSATRIQGSKDLLMTDYGVKPPKILMIKTANEIKVHYDLWLDEKGGLK